MFSVSLCEGKQKVLTSGIKANKEVNENAACVSPLPELSCVPIVCTRNAYTEF